MQISSQLLASSMVLALILATPVSATGPSSATIEITPLAVNECGVIVFKTRSHINKLGAHSPVGTEYGWLLASSEGVWEERLHARVEVDDLGRYEDLEAEFIARADLGDPTASLEDLLGTVPGSDWMSLDSDEGAGRAVWSEDGVCLDGDCHFGDASMSSLHGLRGEGAANPVVSLFLRAGVAVFESIRDYQATADQGAAFHVENLVDGQDVGLDYLRIQAIVLMPDHGTMDPRQ